MKPIQAPEGYRERSGGLNFSEEEISNIARFGDFGVRTLDKISQHGARNKLIVQHYVDKAEQYGKTMVFAANVAHAITLNEEFGKNGVSVDYVAQSRGKSGEVMDAFRLGTGPDVLVSVEMLTEGYDAPATKTVFLARPTQSEALLAQMTGRALRGPAAGGTSEAYLVTFVDTWKQFQVLDPEYLVEQGPVDDCEEQTRAARELIPIPLELIFEAYRLVQSHVLSSGLTVTDCLPAGWYHWEDEFEDDIQTRRILIFDHQLPFFEEARKGKYNLPDAPEAQAGYLQASYGKIFGDCPDPRPRISDLRLLLEARKKNLTIFHTTVAEKDEFSAAKIARQLYDEDVGARSQRVRVQELYDANPTCQTVYRGDFNKFYQDVKSELQEIEHIRSSSVIPDIIEHLPTRPVAEWPADEPGYDLYHIMRDQMDFFPEGLEIHDIRFTDRPMKGYWGQYRHRDKVILVNCLLNSPDVPLFVVEFLVYHELLHGDLPDQGHSALFKEKERGFTPSPRALEQAQQLGRKQGEFADYWRVVADQFLDSYHTQFLTPWLGKMQK